MRARIQSAPLSAATQGYLDGLADARNQRTPEHSQSAYRFPRELTAAEQRDYNDAYYEAKAKHAEADRLNRQWIAKQNEKGWIQL